MWHVCQHNATIAYANTMPPLHACISIYYSLHRLNRLYPCVSTDALVTFLVTFVVPGEPVWPRSVATTLGQDVILQCRPSDESSDNHCTWRSSHYADSGTTTTIYDSRDDINGETLYDYVYFL